MKANLVILLFYNFLPLDDLRYQAVTQEKIFDTIKKICTLSPKATISLHLNAAEKYFPKEMEDSDDNHPLMKNAVRYLHEQIDAYESQGIFFTMATAHGYGRKKKQPNNRDSMAFAKELKSRNIILFDTMIRPYLDSAAKTTSVFNDVGGPLILKKMYNRGSIDSAETYRKFPPGSLIRFLTHPGNYDIQRSLCLGYRENIN